MKIGIVFDQTSTTEFLVMLDAKISDEQLLFSYVEIAHASGEHIIARITSIYKENPLLSRDQAGVAAGINLEQLGFGYSKRFTYGWAMCQVVGTLPNGTSNLDMNRRVIAPNEVVSTPSDSTLRSLFFSPDPSAIPIGQIETVGDEGTARPLPVTLNADQMVTKHFCIFGMTGSGKTNTSAKVIEELMARGHRMVIFDPHDDYLNIERLSALFTDIDADRKRFKLSCDDPQFLDGVRRIQEYIEEHYPEDDDLRKLNKDELELWISGRLLQSTSLIHNNIPTRQLAREKGKRVTQELVNAIAQDAKLRDLTTKQRVMRYVAYPKLRYYESEFTDFVIHLMEAIEGEAFTSAQWRWLSAHINESGEDATYLQNLLTKVSNADDIYEETRDVLKRRFNRLKTIYQELKKLGAKSLDFEIFTKSVALRDSDTPQNVHLLSLSSFSETVRKALVYGVVTYFFRKFKYGTDFRARVTEGKPVTAYGTLFILEEARSLIPKSSGLQDDDVPGSLARRAMRELAYEGRKFSLGYGIISQKPSSVDQEVVSQANTFILHQLKSPDDQQYVRSVTDSMSLEELEMVKSLGTGRAIVSGVAVQSPVLVRVHFRYSEEGIPEPHPIADELNSINNLRSQLNIDKE